jgi:hypothetical protein
MGTKLAVRIEKVIRKQIRRKGLAADLNAAIAVNAHERSTHSEGSTAQRKKTSDNRQKGA